MSADELRLDLEELRRLEGLAKRPRVVSLLSNEIRSVDAKVCLSFSRHPCLASRAAPVPTPAPRAVAAAAAPAGLSYVTLGSFSWDQDNEKIRVYVFLENVDQEKVETTFKPMSVDIKFHDVKGKNYRCAIPKLNKEIVPEKCKIVVKPTKIVITLWKASTGNWLDLHYKEDKFKPSMDKEKDPMSGIMDLMKGMYEEGDEDMKRTIAKAWSDARSGKTADPMKGLP
uniref:Calcyclin-binding protein n=2 Tax=Aegilops tauschii subsp. strangulata TaxID=200361 RepID=A0A453FJD1_AEGTS